MRFSCMSGSTGLERGVLVRTSKSLSYRTSERDFGFLAVFATHRTLGYVGVHAMY